MDPTIELSTSDRGGEFLLLRDGKMVGEMTWFWAGDGVIDVVHTGVRPELRGAGHARRLVLAGVEWARKNGVAVPPDEVERFMQELDDRGGVIHRGQWLQGIGLSEGDYVAISTERVLYHVLGMRGPVWYGYDSWSLEIALLHHLQLTAAADLVGKLHPPAAA